MINIPVIKENVIVRVSGGADSALLLWLICSNWAHASKPLTVWPVTVIHGKRNWQSYYAQQVYDFMQEHWPNVNFTPHKAVLCEDPGAWPGNRWKNNYVYYQERLIDETVEKIGEMAQVFNGVTANPPELIGQKYWGSSDVFGEDVWECREKHRDWDLRHDRKEIDWNELRNQIHCNPFIKLHKGHIAELYKKLGLVNTLLPLTRSCEGWDYMTDGFTQECGECWWCMEKDWAFNVYDQESSS